MTNWLWPSCTINSGATPRTDENHW